MRCSFPGCMLPAKGVGFGPRGWLGVCDTHGALAEANDREVVWLAPHQLAQLQGIEATPPQLEAAGISDETLQYMLQVAAAAPPPPAVAKPVDDPRFAPRPWRH